MKWTINELKKYVGTIENIEVYRYTGLGKGVHTDNLEWLDVNSYEQLFKTSEEIDADVFIMNKDDYNQTICANSHFCWSDLYEEDDKCIVIIIE